MSERAGELIRLLADGAVHTEHALGAALGHGPAALRRQIARLGEFGLEPIRSAAGWRLAGALELLDADRLAATLAPATRARVAGLIVLASVDSTNAELTRRELPEAGVLVCLAEHQSAGRGRGRRRWVSPYAEGLWLSLGWRGTGGAAGLAGLSLALGVAVRRALAALGVAGIMLKWPNDVLAGGRKLGGILVEVAGAEAPCRVVAGIGLNWRLTPALARAIDQPHTDLDALCAGRPPSRNLLAARVIDQALAAQARYADDGLAPFVDEWRAADAFAGREVEVGHGRGRIAGTALGICDDGRLRVATATGERRVVAGELRALGG